MKLSFDLKSLAIGLLVGLTLAALMGAGIKQETGRYQLATSPGHAFVLDTQTGEVWEKFESETGGQTTDNFNEPKNTTAKP